MAILWPLSFIFRTLIHGDKKAGFSIFWADDGLDTGPILLQKTTYVDRNDTVDTLYNRFMYPEGIKAMVGMVIKVQSSSMTLTLASNEPFTNKTVLLRDFKRRRTTALALSWLGGGGGERVPLSWLGEGRGISLSWSGVPPLPPPQWTDTHL